MKITLKLRFGSADKATPAGGASAPNEAARVSATSSANGAANGGTAVSGAATTKGIAIPDAASKNDEKDSRKYSVLIIIPTADERESDFELLKQCEDYVLSRPGAEILHRSPVILAFIFKMKPEEYEKLKWDDAKWKQRMILVQEVPSLEELVQILAKCQQTSDS